VRYAVAASQGKAKLKIASSAWQVQLIEISAGGFAVLATDLMEQVLPGQVGELQTSKGKFEVRVANLSKVATHGSTSPNTFRLRVGLEQLRELTPPGAMGLSGGRRWKSGARRRWRFSYRAIMLFVLTIVLVPILVISDAQSSHHALLRQVLSWGRRAIGLGSEQSNRPPPAPAAADASDASDASTASNAASSGHVGEPADGRALRRLVRDLPGSEPFAAPEVVRTLGLTDPQQGKLGDLRKATTWALRDLDERWPGESRADHTKRRQEVLDAARQEALKILTPSQRAQWMKLTAH
jgi:hypothetical protein